MSRPTAQAHLWLINGGIVDARKSSDLLALQVLAQLHGLVPSLVRQPDGSGGAALALIRVVPQAVVGEEVDGEEAGCLEEPVHRVGHGDTVARLEGDEELLVVARGSGRTTTGRARSSRRAGSGRAGGAGRAAGWSRRRRGSAGRRRS